MFISILRRIIFIEFITFLDGDCFYYDSNALEVMYDACKKTNQKVIKGDFMSLFLLSKRN